MSINGTNGAGFAHFAAIADTHENTVDTLAVAAAGRIAELHKCELEHWDSPLNGSDLKGDNDHILQLLEKLALPTQVKNQLLQASDARARKLVTSHLGWQAVEVLAQQLIEMNNLPGDEIHALLGRYIGPHPDFSV